MARNDMFICMLQGKDEKQREEGNRDVEEMFVENAVNKNDT